jgi:hypothetical protein
MGWFWGACGAIALARPPAEPVAPGNGGRGAYAFGSTGAIPIAGLLKLPARRAYLLPVELNIIGVPKYSWFGSVDKFYSVFPRRHYK